MLSSNQTLWFLINIFLLRISLINNQVIEYSQKLTNEEFIQN